MAQIHPLCATAGNIMRNLQSSKDQGDCGRVWGGLHCPPTMRNLPKSGPSTLGEGASPAADHGKLAN